jgi:hypothetical protein
VAAVALATAARADFDRLHEGRLARWRAARGRPQPVRAPGRCVAELSAAARGVRPHPPLRRCRREAAPDLRRVGASGRGRGPRSLLARGLAARRTGAHGPSWPPAWATWVGRRAGSRLGSWTSPPMRPTARPTRAVRLGRASSPSGCSVLRPWRRSRSGVRAGRRPSRPSTPRLPASGRTAAQQKKLDAALAPYPTDLIGALCAETARCRRRAGRRRRGVERSPTGGGRMRSPWGRRRSERCRVCRPRRSSCSRSRRPRGARARCRHCIVCSRRAD